MRHGIATAARLLAVPTVALVVVVAFVPGRLPLAVRVYALVVGAVALGVAIAALRRAFPPTAPLRAATPRRERPGRPTVLARLENEVILGEANAFDLHLRLAPRLRGLASGLLAARRHVSLEASPEPARRILGEETWELVRADRPAPTDRLARGISRESLARIVDSLERI